MKLRPRLVSVVTIPHTGTRFVCEFLRYIGANYSRRHVGDKPHPNEKHLIVTVRNPHDVYLSHRYKNPPQTDAEFLSLYKTYFAEIANKDVFYFPLDTKDRGKLLHELAQYAECPYKSFPWVPVGETKRDRSLAVPDAMRQSLQQAHLWYTLHE